MTTREKQLEAVLREIAACDGGKGHMPELAQRALDSVRTEDEMFKHGVMTENLARLASALGLREGKHSADSVARIAVERLGQRTPEARPYPPSTWACTKCCTEWAAHPPTVCPKCPCDDCGHEDGKHTITCSRAPLLGSHRPDKAPAEACPRCGEAGGGHCYWCTKGGLNAGSPRPVNPVNPSREAHTDALEAAERICREAADEADLAGHSRQVQMAALDCAARIAEFAATFKSATNAEPVQRQDEGDTARARDYLRKIGYTGGSATGLADLRALLAAVRADERRRCSETASSEWQALQGEQIAYLCDAAREEAYREAVEACAQVARQRAEDVRNGRSAEALTDYDRGEYHAGCWTETRIRALLTTPEKGEETK